MCWDVGFRFLASWLNLRPVEPLMIISNMFMNLNDLNVTLSTLSVLSFPEYNLQSVLVSPLSHFRASWCVDRLTDTWLMCLCVLVCYSHSAAISLGRSAPNRPKRLLLASRSKGEWLRMELKVNGYMARGKPVM